MSCGSSITVSKDVDHGVQVRWPLLDENILCEAVSLIWWRVVYHSLSELGAMCCDIIVGMLKMGEVIT